jgi:hypothetical protein
LRLLVLPRLLAPGCSTLADIGFNPLILLAEFQAVLLAFIRFSPFGSGFTTSS